MSPVRASHCFPHQPRGPPQASNDVIGQLQHNLFCLWPGFRGAGHGLKRLNSEAFVTTETELSAIAPAAIIGLSSHPVRG